MTEQLPKYRVVTESFTNQASLFEDQLNELAELGYRVSQLATVRPIEDWTDGEYIAIMSLKSSPDLQEGEDFQNADIGSERQRELEQAGYIAIANYSKHITWMKPRSEASP